MKFPAPKFVKRQTIKWNCDILTKNCFYKYYKTYLVPIPYNKKKFIEFDFITILPF